MLQHAARKLTCGLKYNLAKSYKYLKQKTPSLNSTFSYDTEAAFRDMKVGGKAAHRITADDQFRLVESKI